MKYILLIHADESANASAEVLERMYAEYGVFTEELRAAGVLGPAEELQPSSTARSVRVREGRVLVTDGPFAEMREQLGGLYVIEAGSMDEACAWAAKVPSATHGTVEVRPLASGQAPG